MGQQFESLFKPGSHIVLRIVEIGDVLCPRASEILTIYDNMKICYLRLSTTHIKEKEKIRTISIFSGCPSLSPMILTIYENIICVNRGYFNPQSNPKWQLHR